MRPPDQAIRFCKTSDGVRIAYAARHPGRVTCLVLLGGYARGLMRRDPSPTELKEAKLLLDLI